MSLLRFACIWTRAVSTRELGSPLWVARLSRWKHHSCDSQSRWETSSSLSCLSLLTAFSMFQELAQRLHSLQSPPNPPLHTGCQIRSVLHHVLPPKVFSSLPKMIPPWRPLIWPLDANPHFPVPATLNQVPCFSSTSYNVKLITWWCCSLLDYSPWHQASPFLSSAVNTCPRRCWLNAHEWIKVY